MLSQTNTGGDGRYSFSIELPCTDSSRVALIVREGSGYEPIEIGSDLAESSSLIGCTGEPQVLDIPLPPPSIAAHRYYPLAVGNIWEYEHYQSNWTNWPSCADTVLTGYSRVIITGDTTLRGNAAYAVTQERYDGSRTLLSEEASISRFDTTDARVTTWNASDEMWGRSWAMPDCGGLNATQGYQNQCFDPTSVQIDEAWSGMIGGMPVSGSRMQNTINLGGGMYWAYIADVGLAKRDARYECSGSLYQLRYARVGENIIGSSVLPSSGVRMVR